MSIADQLTEAVSAETVLETSLGRIWQHHGKTGFAILTAWRGERPEAKDDDEKRAAAKLLAANKKAQNELRGDIKSSGFGFVPVEGVGQEERNGEIVQAPEPSFLVPNAKRGGKPAEEGELRKLVMRLGKKYDQTAVLIHEPESGTEIISPGGAVLARHKTFSPNTVGEFFTRLHRGSTFRTENMLWWGLRYSDPPGNWIEGMGMEGDGRVRIAECSDKLDKWLEKLRRYQASA
jgi:hypothetical protein